MLELHRKQLITAPNFVASPLAALITAHANRLRVLDIDLHQVQAGSATNLVCSALKHVSRLERLTLHRPMPNSVLCYLEALTSLRTVCALGLRFDHSNLPAATEGDAIAKAIGIHTPNITTLILGSFQSSKPVLTHMFERLTAEEYSVTASGDFLLHTADRNLFSRLKTLDARICFERDDMTAICKALSAAANLRECRLTRLNAASIKALARALGSTHQLKRLTCAVERGESIWPVLEAIRDPPNSLLDLEIEIWDDASYIGVCSLIQFGQIQRYSIQFCTSRAIDLTLRLAEAILKAKSCSQLLIDFTNSQARLQERAIAVAIRSNGSVLVDVTRTTTDAIQTATDSNLICFAV